MAQHHTFTLNGGQVLSNVKVQLIFWGAHWQKSPDTSKIEKAARKILSAEYLAGLTQYGVDISGIALDKSVMEPTTPPKLFDDPADVVALVTRLITDGTAAPPDKTLYMVIMPPGIIAASTDLGGQQDDSGRHDSFHYKNTEVHYGWVLSGHPKEKTVPRVTIALSEEVVEAITDPEPPTGWISQVEEGDWEELADVCEGVNAKLSGGTLVRTYYSTAADD